MIVDFADDETRKIFEGSRSRKYTALQSSIERKLRAIDEALDLQDLTEPPGNRLEKLHGDRVGQYSIRVNSQYRICFEWRSNNAYQVEVVDYH